MAVNKKLKDYLETDISHQSKLFNESLGIFDRISSGIDQLFDILSSNDDKLGNIISSDEAEEILKKFNNK